MKKTKTAIFIFLAALCVLMFPHTTYAEAASESLAECVLEVSSRRILSEKNADRTLPMASTTKILTAITVIDDCELDEQVTVPREAAGTEGSSVYLKAGEILTVRDLLYGLMLRSGNDCAVTLAIYHSGCMEKFAEAMNKKAVSLGAEQSYFANPHGLPDNRHKTTARDLAVISAYALSNETFREIVSTKYYQPKNWYNKNKMLTEYSGATGVKTGFTVNAGRCLVTSAVRDGMELVCVVLNSPQMYERSAELLDKGFSAYRLYELACAGEVSEGLKACYGFSYPLTEAEKNLVKTEIVRFETKDRETGTIGGIMKIYLENRLLFSQNLYIMKR